MKRTRAAMLVLAGMLTFAHDGSAQSCLGTASFASGSVRLGASGSFTDGSRFYGGELAVGAANGLFATGNGGSISYEGGSGTSSVIGASLGLEVAVRPGVSFCPLIQYTHTAFPNIPFGNSTITTSANAMGIGGGLGGAVTITPKLDLVPYAEAEYVHFTETANSIAIGSDIESQTYGIIAVGVGVVLNKTVTIRPSVSQPLGLSGAKASFVIGVSINFGHMRE